MDIKDTLGALNTKEGKIYFLIYTATAITIFTILFSLIASYKVSQYVLKFIFNRNNVIAIEKVYNDIELLENDDNKLKAIIGEVNETHYQDRSIIREEVNKDMTQLGMVVRGFTLKDYIPDKSVKEPESRSQGMVLIEMSGQLPMSKLIKFFDMMDRRDRLWRLLDMEVMAPDGSDVFFEKSFQSLTVAQQKEFYRDYMGEGTERMLPVKFSFVTFVKSGSTTVSGAQTPNMGNNQTQEVGN